jgi:hypothetical protein
MSIGKIINNPVFQAVDSSGIPLAGGKVYSYVPGTTTAKATYSDRACTSANTNPVILDSNGQAVIYLLGATKLNLLDADDVQQDNFPVDYIQGLEDGSGNNYYPDYNATDQGDGSETGTIAYYVNLIVASGRSGTITLLNNDAGNTETTYTLTTSETIPDNITLKVERGAVIAIATGVTLTINGFFDAGITQAFSCAGTGKVLFGDSSVIEVNPLWWKENTIPGTTDMVTAIQAAIDSVSAGTYRGNVHITSGAYLVSESIDIGTVDATSYEDGKFIHIYGDRGATQIINAASASKATFDMSGASHWKISDMWLQGNSTHPNIGILVASTAYNWVIEGITTTMAGDGIELNNTNTGTIRDCKNWPSPHENAIIVAQTVAGADQGSGIYMTGSYVHDINVYNVDMRVNSSAPNRQGILCDASSAHGLRVYGGLFQGNDGSIVSIDLTNAVGFFLSGVYFEEAEISFSTCGYGTLIGASTASVSGKVSVNVNSLRITIINVSCEEITITDASAIGTIIIGSDVNKAGGAGYTDSGTDTILTGFSINGAITQPKSSFLAYNSVTDSDVVGDGTSYTVLFDTEKYDTGSDYDGGTGIFTAPKAGKYAFHAAVKLGDLAAAHNRHSLNLLASGVNYLKDVTYTGTSPFVGNSYLEMSAVVNMAAGDTAKIVLDIIGSTKTVDVIGSSDVVTWFSGHLVKE